MKLFLFFIFCTISTVFFAQTRELKINLGVRINRNDFFEENSYLLSKDKLTHEFGLGFGIKKSIFQKRFSPELFYSFYLNLKEINKFQFQVLSAYHFNFYNVNRLSREIHFFNELLLGTQFSYGKKWKIFLQPEFGVIAESFHSDFFKKKQNYFTSTYSFKLGINHAF